MLEFLISLFAIIIIILALFRSKIDKYYDDLEFKKIKNNQEAEVDEIKRKYEKFQIIKEEASNRVIAKFRDELIDEIKPYISTLGLKFNQLVYKDDYGDKVFKDWIKERNNFVNRKLDHISEKIISDCKNEIDILFDFNSYPRYGLRSEVHSYFENYIFSQICELIEGLMQQASIEADNNIIDEVNLFDPILFEKSISVIFQNHKWESKETKTTGDQGADVIAKKGSITCIVQCKLYSNPVGNKAVQEVYSAKNFYKGDIALVVTNSLFTKSAKQLANSTNVILLHYSQLSDFLKDLKQI